MAWSSANTATQLTSITTEQFFTSLISLNPGETAHVQLKVDFPASPTDSAIISVYTTLDASSENWDTASSPFMVLYLDKATDPGSISFSITGVYKFRVGVKRSGTTDTLTSADMKWRTNGISL